MSKDDLNNELVRIAYLLLLGREPESDKAIQSHLELGSISRVRSAIMSSNEFQSKLMQSNFKESKWVITEVLEKFEMWIDLHDRYVSYGCLRNDWEPEESEFFVSRLRAGDVVLDIGANIGWFTLLAAKHIGPAGKVHSFEPRPETVRMLKRTIAHNNLRSVVQVHEFALSDKAEELLLTWGNNTDNPGNSFLSGIHGSIHGSQSFRSDYVTTPVMACRLDDLLADIAPDIIKIDVEGAEPMALAGARNALVRKRPTILSELFPLQLKIVSGRTAPEYISQLEEFGYGCYLLQNGLPTRRLKDFPNDVKRELVSVVFEWRGIKG
ncbi:FkbM family methyltransferase [Rhodoferax antarcticus]|uniref:FkbM family methyltransferase n=1 Tax=Rhodoferax antarcticus TaxID=81479 RepID=UPI002224E794|nr:FkbM family methyltransferase [Rhodoferax antarcticus]MCW2314208.1 FkbM family methyltransferase [Rhodoferax antarcticus]